MFKLRPYQTEASDRCFEDLSTNKKICMVLPTGAGKTETFIDISKRYIDVNPGKSVLILSHMSILTDQTKNRFNLRCPALRVGLLRYGERPGMFDEIIIGTMQTSRHKQRIEGINKKMLKEVGLIIIDEAHLIHAESYQNLISYLPDAKVLGCTATPFRENKIMVNFFDKVSYSMSLGELIDLGYLVPPKLIEMERLSSNIEGIMAQVVRTYQEFENGSSAIVFMQTIKQADTIRNIFVASGIGCSSITSKLTGKSRDDEIQKFNSGNIKVLTTVDVLSVGFDSPRCSCIFQPFATNSVVKYIQRIGRGLRKHDASGKKDCRVYVYGSGPSIERGTYERLQNIALNQNGDIKEYSTYQEEYEYNDYDKTTQTYEWTEMVVRTIERMKGLGMEKLAAQLDRKEFPKRFTDKLDLFLDRLPAKALKVPHGSKPATPRQKGYLESFSFENKDVKDLNRTEASNMIRAIKGPEKGDYAVSEGRYDGYHIAETPFAYRNHVLTNYPNSEIAKTIRSWNNRGKN